MSDNGNKDKLLKKKILTPIINLFDNNISLTSSDILQLVDRLEKDDLILKDSFWFDKYFNNCGLTGEFILTEKYAWDLYKTTIVFNYFIYNQNFSYIEFTKISEPLSLSGTVLIKYKFLTKQFNKCVDLL